MEPTPPGYAYYPEFSEPPTYLQPPPPKSPRTLVLVLVLVSIALVLVVPAAAVLLLHSAAPSAALSPGATPTLDVKNALQTDDFAKFYEAFYDLLNARDFTTIQTAVDTENFQAITLRADPPFPDWSQFENALATEQISLSLPRAQITPDEANLNCFGYDQTGIEYLNLKINALQLMYVVGNATSANTSLNDPFDALNGTVFVFELPEQNAPTWLWRAVTFNNALGC